VKRAVIAVLAVTWLAGCAGLANMPSPALMAGYDWTGLEPIEMRGMDYAAVDPVTDFGGYTGVIVDPVEVSLDRDWAPLRPGSAFEYPEKDLLKLEEWLGQVVHERFVDAFRDGPRYAVVQEPGPGVLRIHARLVDVRLNAPDLPALSRTEQWARSTGEWTLVADLVDAQSGAVVARLVDRWTDPEEQYMQRMTRVENARALQRAADAWALAVRRHLDVADIRNRMEGAGEGLRSTGGK
jgi:hypothetical protein